MALFHFTFVDQIPHQSLTDEEDGDVVFSKNAPHAPHPKRGTYAAITKLTCKLGDPLELQDFSSIVDMQPNGHCGYRAVSEGLSQRLSTQLLTDTDLMNELHKSSSRSVFFRYRLHEFINSNEHRLNNLDDPVFLDEFGQTDLVFKKTFYSNGNEVCNGSDALGRPATTIELLLNRIYR